MTKKIIALTILLAMLVPFCSAAAADEPTSQPTIDEKRAFEPEHFTYEELLSMDQELDSDDDGLVDVIELVYQFNRFDADTDGDGVSDYTEFCITCTDVLVSDGDIDTDGDGLTNAQESFYGTNPDDLDTDNDTFGDYEEIMVLHTDPLVKNAAAESIVSITTKSESWDDPLYSDNSTYAVDVPVIDDGGLGGYTTYDATLYTTYDNTQMSSHVSYQLIDGWFLNNSNTVFNNQLAVTSSLLSAIAYDENYLSNTYTTDPADALEDWFSKHGFSGYECYDLSDTYSDQHVSEMFIAYKTISNTSISKKLICIVIRGTNGTLDEWQSNFDLGSTDDFNSISGWTNPNNHMGFDITSNRLNNLIEAYMSDKGITKSNGILWITGHSRGGALANILAAKQVVNGANVFAYTFASPATTTHTSAGSDTYSCIFNIINTDDFVPQLPLYDWEFVRYGEDKPASIEDSYASQWDAMMTGFTSYTSNKTMVEDVISTLYDIATGRNACYVYRADSTGYIDGLDVQVNVDSITSSYPEVTQPYWFVEDVTGSSNPLYNYRIHQKPAFLMQLLAANRGGELSGVNFGLINVAPYLEDAKSQIAGLVIYNVIKEPHYCESYYLLANVVS